MGSFKEYQYEVIYILIVIISVFALRFITTLIQKNAVKNIKTHEGKTTSAPYLIRRILNTLWLILGITAILILFVSDEINELLLINSKFIVYSTIVAIITIVFASLVGRWFEWEISRRTTRNDDPTSFRFIKYILTGAIYTIGVFLILLVWPGFRGVAQTLLGGAGIIAVIAGIASQEALGNIVSGLFIVFFKPFKIGDSIKMENGMAGRVRDITLRHTVIQNYENRMIIVPNSVINKERLINSDIIDRRVCDRVEINISYESDVDLAKKILQEEFENHPLLLDKRSEREIQKGVPKVKVALVEFAEYAIVIRAWVWAANTGNASAMRFDVLERLKKRFDEEGIVIPYPKQSIDLDTKK